jgi:hypothetical protein
LAASRLGGWRSATGCGRGATRYRCVFGAVGLGDIGRHFPDSIRGGKTHRV